MTGAQKFVVMVGAVALSVLCHISFVQWIQAYPGDAQLLEFTGGAIELLGGEAPIEVLFEVDGLVAVGRSGTGRETAIGLGVILPLAMLVAAIVVWLAPANPRRLSDKSSRRIPALVTIEATSTSLETQDEARGPSLGFRMGTWVHHNWSTLRYPAMAFGILLIVWIIITLVSSNAPYRS